MLPSRTKRGEIMATPKRYFWMKLKESFMTSDTIDYFMSQPDGANYVVLYQMLCLMTINTNGHLSRQIGEVIIPYDVDKIRRDTKWFSADTIRVALKLYQAFGLIYEDVDGTLTLTDHANLVGSESDAAARMRSSRANRKAELPEGVTDGEQCSNIAEQSANIVTPDIRYQILDIRDQSLYIRESAERENDATADKPPDAPQAELTTKNKKKSVARFIPPTVDEVQAYCQERNNHIDAAKFVDYYSANGWKVGRTKMVDWKAAVRTWESRSKNDSRTSYGTTRETINGKEYEVKNGKYYIPGGSGIAVNPHAPDDLPF